MTKRLARSDAEQQAVWLARLSGLAKGYLDGVIDAGLPMPRLEDRVVASRLWRYDFAWPDRRLAVEVDGGVYAGGRHTTGAGYTADCEKRNTAQLGGWRVLNFTSRMIDSGLAIAQTVAAYHMGEA